MEQIRDAYIIPFVYPEG